MKIVLSMVPQRRYQDIPPCKSDLNKANHRRISLSQKCHIKVASISPNRIHFHRQSSPKEKHDFSHIVALNHDISNIPKYEISNTIIFIQVEVITSFKNQEYSHAFTI